MKYTTLLTGRGCHPLKSKDTMTVYSYSQSEAGSKKKGKPKRATVDTLENYKMKSETESYLKEMAIQGTTSIDYDGVPSAGAGSKRKGESKRAAVEP